MNRTDTLLALAVGAVWLFTTTLALAQHAHHPLHEDFYSKWKQPDSGASCCNARLMINGTEMGDCEPSEAKLAIGADGKVHWFARRPHGGDFIEIPDSRIIRERNPEQGGQQGHLCYNYGMVYCFVPPDTGG